MVFLLWWGTQAAPKRIKPEKAPEEWFFIPERKSKRQKQAEEEFGQALRNLIEKNKISSQESMNIFEKAYNCGLRFASPASAKMSREQEPAKATEKPANGRDKNAARACKRFLRKRKMWGEFYWAPIPIWKPKEKNGSHTNPFSIAP